MSYKYNHSIQFDLDHLTQYEDVSDLEEKKMELDHVYSQAAKADKYENNKYRTHVKDRKAEAFDAILKSYDEALSEGHMADEVSNIIEKYESGESDA